MRKLFVLGVLGVALSLVVVPRPPEARAYTSTRIQYGFPNNEVAAVEGTGATLGYGSVWAEWWAATHDFSNIRTAMQQSYRDGVTPMIMWYYWGGYANQRCMNNASDTTLSDCGGRTRNDWMAKADRLAQVVSEEIGTDTSHSAVIIVEPEFHNSSTDGWETLDGWLETQAGKFHAKAREIVVAGFGEWASTGTTYPTFDRFGNASDYIGTQILFSCVQQTDTYYQSAAARISTQATNAQAKWPAKPVFVYDVGLSSYSGQSDEPSLYPNFRSQYPNDRRRDCKVAGDYEVQQEAAVQKIFDKSAELKSKGVIAIVFRALNDQENRSSTDDWHGLAERWFGFRRASATPPEKLAYDNVIAAIKAENNGGTPPPPPAPGPSAPESNAEWWREAESFDSHPVGQAAGDADASSDAYWNLWSNGAITTAMTAATTGAKQVKVIARGDPAAAVWPAMKVTVDTTVVLDTSVDSTVWDTYVATTPSLSAGSHTLKIEFTNDANVNGEDRNLKLDIAWLVPAPAATPPPPPPPTGAEWQLEGELFPTHTSGSATSETGASGGAHWNLSSNGYLETTSFTAATTGAKEIRVTARGDIAGGLWPLMRVSVDGAYASEQSVSRSTYAVYAFPVTLTAGTHTLRVEYTNDAVVGVEDRNLRVDVAALYPVANEWFQEIETFPTSTAGQSTSSTTASASAYWNLWSNGSVSTTMTAATAGTKQLRIAARGASAGGVWPIMRIDVDGAPVSTQTVGTATWVTYTAAVDLTAGGHTLTLNYLNDAVVGTEDRNLHLDTAALVPAAPSWSREAEAFGTRPVGQAQSDGTASGGLYWNLWSNGSITTGSATVPRTAAYRVEITARGDSANGVWPNMTLWVDNVAVRSFTVTTNTWRTYGAVLDLTPGAHTMSLEFTNDALTPTEDRNLKLDLVRVLG